MRGEDGGAGLTPKLMRTQVTWGGGGGKNRSYLGHIVELCRFFAPEPSPGTKVGWGNPVGPWVT